MNDGIRVQVNGSEREVPAGLSVRDLLVRLELRPEMVIVERNGEILRRQDYADAPVDSGDSFELVHYVGGG